jgi:hypothetical protein
MIVPCDLYHGGLDNYMIFVGQIAEGTYNFTSTSEPSQIIGGLEDERVAEEEQNEYENDDEIHILDGVGPSQRRDEASSVNQGKFSYPLLLLHFWHVLCLQCFMLIHLIHICMQQCFMLL